MAGLNETPSANRIRISFFGLRNAGKSTLVNAFTGQTLAIVSDTPGTTTDPVSKAMEILPLGPCLVTDTAGLDDVGELGQLRVEKTLKVLETTDVAVWVCGEDGKSGSSEKIHADFIETCAKRKIAVLEYHRGESAASLRERIAALKLTDDARGLLDGLVGPKTRVVCVCPIDESAPKGRLILPQVQMVRDCLDRHLVCTVCQPGELSGVLASADSETLVVTDSQAFGEVSRAVGGQCRLTSFSILYARQKGRLEDYLRGLKAVRGLKDGDRVLVAEGCTHHRQCNDIGTTKIPKALAKLTGGKNLAYTFASGTSFPISGELSSSSPSPSSSPDSFASSSSSPSLVVHCGGCMLTRREVIRRLDLCRAAGIPVVNYGILLAAASGLDVAKMVPPPMGA